MSNFRDLLRFWLHFCVLGLLPRKETFCCLGSHESRQGLEHEIWCFLCSPWQPLRLEGFRITRITPLATLENAEAHPVNIGSRRGGNPGNPQNPIPAGKEILVFGI